MYGNALLLTCNGGRYSLTLLPWGLLLPPRYRRLIGFSVFYQLKLTHAVLSFQIALSLSLLSTGIVYLCGWQMPHETATTKEEETATSKQTEAITT